MKSGMIETERKFTVAGDFWKEATNSCHITQGYLCAERECTVRVRMAGNGASLTVKGPSDEKGWSRYEFEQEIPPADAAELIKLCRSGIIDKVRYYIPWGKHVWEVDVFRGANEGLLIAEIELSSGDESFEKPAWLGEEVTGDERYYNTMLARRPYTQWKRNE
ncbi:MAG: CYTH domain-containing protein [Tannerellaceae bacterium]|jgi:CYTH domain-containing protein|nr:CYTH domain-containing protein [Tannerellaceae bacterium]